MPVAPFKSFQAYDCVVAISKQASYGARITPSKALIASKAAISIVNRDIDAAGTTGYRGAFIEQRTASTRFASVDINAEAMDTASLQELLNIALGGNGELTNDIGFGAVGVRHSDGKGMTLNDVACIGTTLTFRSGETADIEFSGICLTDWQANTAPPEAEVEQGTPLLIDDLVMEWNGIELPFTEVALSLTQTIIPDFANSAFPVSYQALNDRNVVCRVVFSPTTTTYAMLEALRSKSHADLNMHAEIGDFTALLRNARVLQSSFPDFEGGNVQPIEVVFGGTATDASQLELEVEIG